MELSINFNVDEDKEKNKEDDSHRRSQRGGIRLFDKCFIFCNSSATKSPRHKGVI